MLCLSSTENDGSMGEVSTCSSSDTTGSYSSTMDDSNEAEDTGDVCSGGVAPAGSSSETVGGGDEATGAGSNCSSDEATAGSSSGSCFGTAVVAGFSTAHLRGARGCFGADTTAGRAAACLRAPDHSARGFQELGTCGCFGTDTTAGRAAPCLGTIGRDDEVDGILLGSGEGCSTRDDSASQNCFTAERRL